MTLEKSAAVRRDSNQCLCIFRFMVHGQDQSSLPFIPVTKNAPAVSTHNAPNRAFKLRYTKEIFEESGNYEDEADTASLYESLPICSTFSKQFPTECYNIHSSPKGINNYATLPRHPVTAQIQVSWINLLISIYVKCQ